MLGCSEEREVQQRGLLPGLLPAGQRSTGAHGALYLPPQLPQPRAGQGIAGTAGPESLWTRVRDAGPCQRWSSSPAPRNPPSGALSCRAVRGRPRHPSNAGGHGGLLLARPGSAAPISAVRAGARPGNQSRSFPALLPIPGERH